MAGKPTLGNQLYLQMNLLALALRGRYGGERRGEGGYYASKRDRPKEAVLEAETNFKAQGERRGLGGLGGSRTSILTMIRRAGGVWGVRSRWRTGWGRDISSKKV